MLTTPTTLYARVKQAFDTAWVLAEEEASDPDRSDPRDQEREIERLRAGLRPLLRELKLVDELREFDTAWEVHGFKRRDETDGTVAWHYCTILDVIPSILDRIEMRLSSESPDKSPLAVSDVEISPVDTRTLRIGGGELILRARNFYGLRDFELPLEAVTLLVGANGAGKTTTLLLLKLMRAALDRGLAAAVGTVLGGGHGLKHRDAGDDEPVEIGIQVGELRWSVQLRPRDASVDHLAEEALHDGEQEIFHRDALGNFRCGDHELRPDNRLGLRAVFDSQIHEPAVDRMVGIIRSITVFHDPDLYALRAGSHIAHSAHLASRGTNAITMMRSWHLNRLERHRVKFVLAGLKAAFPGLIEDFDYVEAGNTLAARVYRPGREQPEPLRNEANGVLSMLVLLCDLAGAEDGGVVAIDEPETALHPFAIRAFARFARQRSEQSGLRILLATHSPVLLDEFDSSPERVFVLGSGSWPGPTALTELKNPEWLRQFRLGELYTDGVFGSNDERG